MADQEKIERSHDSRISDHAVSQTQDGLFQQEVPQGKTGIKQINAVFKLFKLNRPPAEMLGREKK